MGEVKNGNGKSLYIAMIIVLLALNAWLFYSAQQNKKERITYAKDYARVDSMYTTLESDYNKLMLALENDKGESYSKDSVIAVLESQLKVQYNEIQNLKSGSNIISGPSGSKQLQEAKERIAKLESELSFYLTKINEYTDQYNALLEDYKELKNDYKFKVEQNTVLQNDRDSIYAIGSTVMTAGIYVIPVLEKNSGEKEASKAKRTEKLKINFELVPNLLSAGRSQTFFLQLIDPNNVIMQSGNSGTSDYSAMIQVDYGGQKKETHTVYWDQNYTFLPGAYTIKMFHNGYTVGEETFQLK
ncbi:MAG: hypothetical protein ACK4IY_03065 [Chitinophagales bacterium]